MDATCIWITGGGSGLGAALAIKLARQGKQVVVSGRDTGDLASLAAGDPRIRTLPLDITDSVAVQNGVAKIEREIGPIALALLNAGTSYPTPAVPFDLERMRGLLDINLGGTLNCLAALVPALQQRGAGHVAILSSAAGFRGLPRAGAYSAGKAALTALAESLDLDLADSGVSVQVINPGFVAMGHGEADIVTAEKAADLVLKALKSTTRPRRFAGLMKLLRRWLPDPVYFRLTRNSP